MLANSKSIQWLVLIGLALIWGSSFILMKRGMVGLTSLQVASMRIVVGGLCLLPFAIYHFKQVNLKTILPLAIVGYLGNFFPALLFTTAQTQIPSALAGMLNAATPFFTLLLGVLFFATKTNKAQVIAIGAGLAFSIALIFTSKSIQLNSSSLTVYLYSGMALLATFFYGISVNTIKSKLTGINPVAISALSFATCLPAALVIFFQQDTATALISNPLARESGYYVVALGLIGTALALVVYNYLIKASSALFASTVTYLIPIVAIFWGLFDGENILLVQVLLIVAILISVYFVNRGKNIRTQ